MHWGAYWKSVEMLLVIDKLSIEKSWNASNIDKNTYCKVLKMLMTMNPMQMIGMCVSWIHPYHPEFLNLRFHFLSPTENRLLKSKFWHRFIPCANQFRKHYELLEPFWIHASKLVNLFSMMIFFRNSMCPTNHQPFKILV